MSRGVRSYYILVFFSLILENDLAASARRSSDHSDSLHDSKRNCVKQEISPDDLENLFSEKVIAHQFGFYYQSLCENHKRRLGISNRVRGELVRQGYGSIVATTLGEIKESLSQALTQEKNQADIWKPIYDQLKSLDQDYQNDDAYDDDDHDYDDLASDGDSDLQKVMLLSQVNFDTFDTFYRAYETALLTIEKLTSLLQFIHNPMEQQAIDVQRLVTHEALIAYAQTQDEKYRTMGQREREIVLRVLEDLFPLE